VSALKINTILIANRGEIAVRIIRTCRRMGIRAVAVYSTADRYALHVGLADAAVLIGPAESARSYLNSDAIIAAAQRAGVDAIHPGYGFLSESEALIGACEHAGLIFIGPHREAIRRMGSKIESKTLAEQAGVPTVPGYHGTDQSESALLSAAGAIGFPLMIKASAGGGGRGMRRIDRAEQLVAELPQARQEALSGFGDDQVLLEKLITSARHIEVQLAADKQGQIVHLFERECSIQRHHQKVIEEAPAAFLDEAQRTRLYRDAITLGQAIEYDSLGTVEFLLDNATGKSYFLEMNTRLQVEHPVTEAITGLDLVEWQIRIASGEPLPLTQGQISATGWAIEARINAEDTAHGYRPETGTITICREPSGEDVRVDSGVRQGSVITPYYDPMLAKVIGRGADREHARRVLLRGLSDYTLAGVGNNLEFLHDIVAHPNFTARALTTNYLNESFVDGWRKPFGDDTMLVCAAIARVMLLEQAPAERHVSPWQSLGGFRLLERAGFPGQSRVILATSEADIEVVTVSGLNGVYQASIASREPKPMVVQAQWQGREHLQIEIDGLSRRLLVDVSDEEIALRSARGIFHYRCLDEQELALRDHAGEGSGECHAVATLPGQVVEINVKPGDKVSKGDVLVVLDSMKLLHELTAQRDGMVAAVFCEVSDSVDGGVMLIELTPDSPTNDN